MRVLTKDRREYVRSTDVAPGFPENPLTKEEHVRRFADCVEFAATPPHSENVAGITESIARLEEMPDVRELVPLLDAQSPGDV
jgi:hypothetical protein